MRRARARSTRCSRSSSTREAPRCPACGAILKPGVVMFGELLPLDAIARAEQLAREAALLLVVGSSLQVWPVAGLPEHDARERRRARDRQPRADAVRRARAALVVRGPAGEHARVGSRACSRREPSRIRPGCGHHALMTVCTRRGCRVAHRRHAPGSPQAAGRVTSPAARPRLPRRATDASPDDAAPAPALRPPRAALRRGTAGCGSALAAVLRPTTALRRPGGAAIARFERTNVNGVRRLCSAFSRYDAMRRATRRGIASSFRSDPTAPWAGCGRADVALRRVTTRILVDLSDRRVTLFRDGRPRAGRRRRRSGSRTRRRRPAGTTSTSACARPTRLGRSGPARSASRRSRRRCRSWAQGGPIAIHGTNSPVQARPRRLARLRPDRERRPAAALRARRGGHAGAHPQLTAGRGLLGMSHGDDEADQRQGEYDAITRLASKGEATLARLADLPGGTQGAQGVQRPAGAGRRALSKKVRGIDALEAARGEAREGARRAQAGPEADDAASGSPRARPAARRRPLTSTGPGAAAPAAAPRSAPGSCRAARRRAGSGAARASRSVTARPRSSSPFGCGRCVPR